jgi:hypothetical protein
MADKLVSRLLLIGLAIVILIVLVTQYNSTKAGSQSVSERYSEPMLLNNDQPIIRSILSNGQVPIGPTQPRMEQVERSLQQAERKQLQVERKEPQVGNAPTMPNVTDDQSYAPFESAAQVQPSEPLANEDYKAIDFSTESKLPADCFPRDRLTADDLLPKDAANSKWAQVNPAGQGDVKDQNFLTAGHHIGINTVGQTLRNPNYQIRSEPANPRMNVGPWNQTTIEFDNSRRSFEVGQC